MLLFQSAGCALLHCALSTGTPPHTGANYPFHYQVSGVRLQPPTKYMFSLWIQFAATLSVCGRVTAHPVLFLDTQSLRCIRFVESAQESCVGGGENGDPECIKATCCQTCGDQQAWVVCPQHNYITSGISTRGLECLDVLDTDVSTFNSFGHHFDFLKLFTVSQFSCEDLVFL